MTKEIMKLLSINLECINYQVKNNQYIFEIQSALSIVECPYCGSKSSKFHSFYQLEIQDIPIQDKQTVLLVNTRKMVCSNSKCKHKTFAESFEFAEPYSKKTKRLIENFLLTSTKLSSVSASTLLKNNSINAVKVVSVICLKKMPSIVDKSHVKKVCVDDFAIRKRYTYGTVMVDLESHRIIDILE